MKKLTAFALTISLMLSLTACGKTEPEVIEEEVPETIEEITFDVLEEDVPQIEGYNLLWHDEFNGDTLDKSIWDREVHKPGWVNNELQEYTVSEDNCFVKDGNLVIKAIKETDENGKDHYTSARIRTRYKKEFTYGRVEASIKVPKGKGLWPAFWMLPCSEQLYGQWPVSGEIDIMEILGDNPRKTYATIHYGLPHSSSGGNYSLPFETPDFSEEFHVFAVEWEPEIMRFYVDDKPVYTATKWFSGFPKMPHYPFPAPFDADFHVIINLAVGGDWPGSPNASTDFENAELFVDYVRVYQLSE